MSYLSYKQLQGTLIDSLSFHRNKLKIRVYNTNPPFASIPALYTNNIAIKKRLDNITPLRTDYIDGKNVSNNKVELIVDVNKETLEDTIELLTLAYTNGLMNKSKYEQLLAYKKREL